MRSEKFPRLLTSPSLAPEIELAARLARAAGRAAMRYYGAAEAWFHTSRNGLSPVTEADRVSNGIITEGLRWAFPDDDLLSEESPDGGTRLGRERVWIVDPLDGTKEFLSRNGEFSVMIGLAVGGEPVLGVVYLPVSDLLYVAARHAGAWVVRGGSVWRLQARRADLSRIRLIVSRSHADPLLDRIQDALGAAEVRACGSVGVKCARIAEGESDLYIHPVPYLKEWDTCAPEVLLREAGGEVSDCFGVPLRYNKPDPVQPFGILAGAPGTLAPALDRLLPILAGAPIGRALTPETSRNP